MVLVQDSLICLLILAYYLTHPIVPQIHSQFFFSNNFLRGTRNQGNDSLLLQMAMITMCFFLVKSACLLHASISSRPEPNRQPLIIHTYGHDRHCAYKLFVIKRITQLISGRCLEQGVIEEAVRRATHGTSFLLACISY